MDVAVKTIVVVLVRLKLAFSAYAEDELGRVLFYLVFVIGFIWQSLKVEPLS